MDWHELEAVYCELAGITPEDLRRDMEQRLVAKLPEGTTAQPSSNGSG